VFANFFDFLITLLRTVRLVLTTEALRSLVLPALANGHCRDLRS